MMNNQENVLLRILKPDAALYKGDVKKKISFDQK